MRVYFLLISVAMLMSGCGDYPVLYESEGRYYDGPVHKENSGSSGEGGDNDTSEWRRRRQYNGHRTYKTPQRSGRYGTKRITSRRSTGRR